MSNPTSHTSLHVCLVTAGEPLPSDRPDIRLHRTGQLASWLSDRGHRVDWVTNRFDHFRKIHRPGPGTQHVSDTYRIHLLDSPGYRRNVSLARFWDHDVLGRGFRGCTAGFGHPDIVVAAMPTIELAYEAVRWARSIEVSSIVDIRDLWPDVIIESAPWPLRWTVRQALTNLQRKLDSALAQADAIVSPNDEFIDWGCRKGKRMRGVFDAKLPLGFEYREISPADRLEAVSFFQSKGIDLLNNQSPILVFAGSLSRQFDFEPILALLAHPSALRVRVVLCGVGEQQAALAGQIGKIEGLFLPGWCSYTQLRVLMEHSMLGLMPYRNTSNFVSAIPNKAAEYFAHGLPVAWSLGTGPLDELIRNRSLGVSYGESTETLLRYVRELQQHESRRRASRATAQVVFHELFDAEEINQRFARLLFDIVARARSKKMALK